MTQTFSQYARKFRSYSKADVDTHIVGYGYTSYPAVNVKAYHFPLPYKVEVEFGCSEKTAENAIEYAFDLHRDRFWENVEEWAKEVFDRYNTEVYSAGRQGGWVIVEGLPDLAEWDAVLLAKWRKFERWCQSERDYLCEWDTVKGAIEANRWHEEGAELHNFCNRDGKTFCVAELRQAERAAVEQARNNFFATL